MTQEQLIQEARKEAEKFYPKNTASHYSKSREDNEKKQKIFIKGYLAKAEKRNSEAVIFADWLKKECYNYHISFDTYVWRKLNDDITSYTSEEIYDLFIQQQLKQE